MAYNIIKKQDVVDILELIDMDLEFLEKDLELCYTEAKEDFWDKHKQLLLKEKERALIYNLYIRLDEEGLESMNEYILERRE